ncbi:MAG: hypothetical protein IKC22_01195 [Bacilli bacterium]|nr:hypothetical protein [Bacilli bacterium]
MSIVIGLKYKDGVLLASDTRVVSRGHLAERNVDGKIFKSQYSNTAIGSVGYLRDLDIISCTEEWLPYKDILDKKKVDKKYIIENIVPKIFNTLRDNHRVNQKDGFEYTDSEFIFATPSHLYRIDEDGSVLEFDDYISVGCGEELVRGYMTKVFYNGYKDLSLEEAKFILRECIKEACKDDIGINDESVFINLEKGD